MTTSRAAAAGLALAFTLGSALLDDANAARQHQGGGGASFQARSNASQGSFAARAGGAQVAARSSNNAARFTASAAGFSFSAGTRPSYVAAASSHRQHARSHWRGLGYTAAFAVPLVSYGYITRVRDRCYWLKERYEETGLKKWRLRYEACVEDDD